MLSSIDTAPIAIFDPSRLSHRLSDTPEWWSVLWDEVEEINSGTLATAGLGSTLPRTDGR
jgi:hypothetical protein